MRLGKQPLKPTIDFHESNMSSNSRLVIFESHEAFCPEAMWGQNASVSDIRLPLFRNKKKTVLVWWFITYHEWTYLSLSFLILGSFEQITKTSFKQRKRFRLRSSSTILGHVLWIFSWSLSATDIRMPSKMTIFISCNLDCISLILSNPTSCATFPEIVISLFDDSETREVSVAAYLS